MHLRFGAAPADTGFPAGRLALQEVRGFVDTITTCQDSTAIFGRRGIVQRHSGATQRLPARSAGTGILVIWHRPLWPAPPEDL
ncbi:MAG TPA: hypothetical protein DHU96_26600 [Actinobacteria bacterium]|nr:hypothetical protein [Actinomycetota bacterium]